MLFSTVAAPTYIPTSSVGGGWSGACESTVHVCLASCSRCQLGARLGAVDQHLHSSLPQALAGCMGFFPGAWLGSKREHPRRTRRKLYCLSQPSLRSDSISSSVVQGQPMLSECRPQREDSWSPTVRRAGEWDLLFGHLWSIGLPHALLLGEAGGEEWPRCPDCASGAPACLLLRLLKGWSVRQQHQRHLGCVWTAESQPCSGACGLIRCPGEASARKI